MSAKTHEPIRPAASEITDLTEMALLPVRVATAWWGNAIREWPRPHGLHHAKPATHDLPVPDALEADDERDLFA